MNESEQLKKFEQLKEEFKEKQKVFNRRRNKLIKDLEEVREKINNYEYCHDGDKNYLNEEIQIIKNITNSRLTSIIADLYIL